MKHILKIQDRFYNQIESWEKTFEIRLNDRGFQKWDTIQFIEIDENEEDWEGCEYDTQIIITNVFQEKWFWLEEWYCILSFRINS